ncbi:hypothetical protein [Thermococcus sp.]|uniref:hypothetical protein n=1 Tax=Thermococcus sp. TaxID=35749 RepID=UPI002612A1F3|nr:hypothetical protein [Thermococcus sp.]
MRTLPVLISLLMLLISLPFVAPIHVDCNNTAHYNEVSGGWVVECHLGNTSENLEYLAKIGKRTTVPRTVSGSSFEVWIRPSELVNFSSLILSDAVLSNTKVPVTVHIFSYDPNGSFEITMKHFDVHLGTPLKVYVLSSIWGVMALILFLGTGYEKHESGSSLVSSILGIHLIFRGTEVTTLSSIILIPFIRYSLLIQEKSEISLLVLSGLSALLLFESGYAFGLYKSKYPKVSFYTGLGWIAGIPIVFNFFWDDFLIPFFATLILAIPVAVVIWKYTELPYSSCHKALTLFRTYSIPLGVGVALVLALQYTTEETLPLFAVFLVSLLLYAYASKLAFNRLEWAKRKFDEDIEGIRKRMIMG